MPSNKKRSFFERLAGGINFEEEGRSLPIVSSDSRDSDTPEVELGEEGELSIDMHQTSAEIVIQAMIAGVKPADLSVDISRDSVDRKSTRLNSSHIQKSRMPSSA